MINLSERLAAIADYVQKGETIADIGTDHGLLPIFLLLESISPKAVLCDIKKGPLEKAKANLHIYAPETRADLRLGGGLEPLEIGEVDTVIIAGMGGLMITKILEADPMKTRSFRKFILQPRNGRDKLRVWLYNQGYTIVKERLVREGNYICEIFVVETAVAADMDKREASLPRKLENFEFEISPLLFSHKDPLLKEFIACKINVEESIIESVRQKGSEASLRKLEKNKERLSKLYELQKRANNS